MATDRNGRPKQSQLYYHSGVFTLSSGAVIHDPVLCYETYGTYRPEENNVILLFHALSGDSHCASHEAGDAPGWWESCVGPGKAIDTDIYFVVCINTLGGCRGSTGPGSINPLTNEPYGSAFPGLTIEDMVRFQHLLIKHLGIDTIRCAIGASMGGMLALQWGLTYTDITSGVVVIASAHRLSTQALAFDIVGRNAILHDPDFHNGNYASLGTVPSKGLAIARMIGHITYLSPEIMNSKFESDRFSPRNIDTAFEKLFSVGSYLGYQGDKFVERFDANSYITLTKAMDHFDLGGTFDTLQKRFSGNRSNWLFMTFSSDWLFPPAETETCLRAISHNNVSASYCSFQTGAGHDAFLLPQVVDDFTPLLQTFIRSASAPGCSCGTKSDSLRQDLAIIRDLIEPSSSVLDTGCGRGELLEALCEKGCSPLYGIDNSRDAVVACISKGIPAICSDINDGLGWFAENSFDYAVLSLTLQAVSNVVGILNEILRVGRRAVVTFP
ncbi:MAG: homoserine O-acetyltransferase MetX, partial [Spirochaetota bacterium]